MYDAAFMHYLNDMTNLNGITNRGFLVKFFAILLISIDQVLQKTILHEINKNAWVVGRGQGTLRDEGSNLP